MVVVKERTRIQNVNGEWEIQHLVEGKWRRNLKVKYAYAMKPMYQITLKPQIEESQELKDARNKAVVNKCKVSLERISDHIEKVTNHYYKMPIGVVNQVQRQREQTFKEIHKMIQETMYTSLEIENDEMRRAVQKAIRHFNDVTVKEYIDEFIRLMKVRKDYIMKEATLKAERIALEKSRLENSRLEKSKLEKSRLEEFELERSRTKRIEIVVQKPVPEFKAPKITLRSVVTGVFDGIFELFGL